MPAHPRAGPSPQRVVEIRGQPPSAEALRDLAALREAVGKALDRKRRLGQYAVVWQDGRARVLPPEALPVWPTGAPDAGPTSNR